MNDIKFQKAEYTDLDIILGIYNFYISTTTATFDHRPISQREFLNRIFINHEKYQIYLILSDQVIGFCFLTRHNKKKAYDQTGDIGIYLKPEFTGKGIGVETVTFLENLAIVNKFRVIIASISGENIPSMKLFQKTGFEKCAHYKQIGKKFGRFVDIIDFQKILDI